MASCVAAVRSGRRRRRRAISTYAVGSTHGCVLAIQGQPLIVTSWLSPVCGPSRDPELVEFEQESNGPSSRLIVLRRPVPREGRQRRGPAGIRVLRRHADPAVLALGVGEQSPGLVDDAARAARRLQRQDGPGRSRPAEIPRPADAGSPRPRRTALPGGASCDFSLESVSTISEPSIDHCTRFHPSCGTKSSDLRQNDAFGGVRRTSSVPCVRSCDCVGYKMEAIRV